MTLLGFLLALGLLITVHEWGHYRVALACGVHVQRFAIGFGRPVVRWLRQDPRTGWDTEFVIGLIPLGGYVKMLDGREETLNPGQQQFAFDQQSLRARTAIVLAGPLANLGLAVLLYAVTFGVGQWETKAILAKPVMGSPAETASVHSGEMVLRAGATADALQEVVSLEDLRWQLMQHPSEAPLFLELADVHGQHRRLVDLPRGTHTDANGLMGLSSWGLQAPWVRAVIGQVVPGGAADRAGLQSQDRVTDVQGQRVEDATHLRALIRAGGTAAESDEPLWRVDRNGQLIDVPVVLDRVEESGHRIGRLGAYIGEPAERVWVSRDVFSAVAKGLERTWEVMQLTVRMLGRMVQGQASWDNLSGPLSMAEMAGKTMAVGWGAYVAYLALLSVSLGVFNLLPLPVLDGGQLMYYLYEFLTGHPPAARWHQMLQQTGVALLMALMVFAIFNDLARLGWLP